MIPKIRKTRAAFFAAGAAILAAAALSMWPSSRSSDPNTSRPSIEGREAQKSVSGVPLTFGGLTAIEIAAVERCTRERGGNAPEFTRAGLGCYVFFPSSVSFSVPPPPQNNASEAKILVAMKNKRTPDVLKAIQSQSDDPMPELWAAAGIDPIKNPKFADRIRIALNDGANLTLKVKASFERIRPHAVNTNVEPVVEVPWHSAYPSGHATQAVLVANILACAKPEAKAKLDALAIQIGRNREIAGLHYPSDTEAGFLLGKAIYHELMKNSAFSCALDS